MSVEGNKIDLMKAQRTISSLCADIDLTREICEIDGVEFGPYTKIVWALPTDEARTLALLDELLPDAVDWKLETVRDAFRFISAISFVCLAETEEEDKEK